MSENRRNEIYAVKYIVASGATYRKYPFYNFASVTGALNDIEPLVKFTWEEIEENHGRSWLQKFAAISGDTSSASRDNLERVTRTPVLLILYFTNGERRVVGTTERPVEMLMSETGNPKQITLSFQRYSEARAPLYQSF